MVNLVEEVEGMVEEEMEEHMEGVAEVGVTAVQRDKGEHTVEKGAMKDKMGKMVLTPQAYLDYGVRVLEKAENQVVVEEGEGEDMEVTEVVGPKIP